MKEGMLRAHIRHDVLCAEVEFHDGASDDEIKQAMEKAGAKIMREIIDLHHPKEAHIYMHLGFATTFSRDRIVTIVNIEFHDKRRIETADCAPVLSSAWYSQTRRSVTVKCGYRSRP